MRIMTTAKKITTTATKKADNAERSALARDHIDKRLRELPVGTAVATAKVLHNEPEDRRPAAEQAAARQLLPHELRRCRELGWTASMYLAAKKAVA